MRVFIFICAVIILTSAQIARSSPLEIIENNEVPVESNDDDDDSEIGSYNQEDGLDAEIIQNDEIAVEDDFVEENVGGEFDEGDDDDDDDTEEEVDTEMLERTIGIEIPICAQYADLTYPLHTSHLSDCSKFYKCSNGRGHLFDCPAGEVWSVKLDRCDYVELVGCKVDGTHQYKLRKLTVQAAANENDDSNAEKDFGDFEIDPRCEGGDPFKPNHLPHPNDCTKFYKCYMGKAYVIKCPKGQHWNVRMNRCDHASLARCSAIKVVSASMSVPYMDIDEEKREKIHTIVDDPDYMIADKRCQTDEDNKYHPIHFAHPTNCQMFYKCFNNFAYKVSCPEGLHFYAKNEACDYPSVAKCNVGKNLISVQAAAMEVKTPSIPDCSHGRTVNYGMQGQLSRYFTCRNGEVYLMECALNEFFNPNTMLCDLLPSSSQIQQPSQYSPNYLAQYPSWGYPNYSNWGVNSNYPSWGSSGSNSNNNNNNKFNYPQQPPQQKPSMPEKKPVVEEPHFAPEAPIIPVNPDFPSWLPQPNLNVNYPSFNQYPQESESSNDGGFNFSVGKPNSRCPSTDDVLNPVHLSHESSCSKFYKCFNGRAFEMECPEEQEWSDVLSRCDFHMFANCDPSELLRRRTHN